MQQDITHIDFDRNKHPGIDFEIMPINAVLEQDYGDHSPLRPHRLNFYLLLIITGGEGLHTIDFLDYPCHRGTVLTIRKDQVHQFQKTMLEGYMLLFTEEFVLSYLEQTGAHKIRELFNELLFSQQTVLEGEAFAQMLALVSEIATEFGTARDEHSPGIIRNLLQVLVSRLHRHKAGLQESAAQKYREQFLAFQQLVEAHCAENRSVQFYAEKLAITPRTLHTITRAVIGKSSKEFIDQLCVLRIKRLLINSSLSIKEIAFAMGFEETTNFFKYMKRMTGMTPEAFREAHIAG